MARNKIELTDSVMDVITKMAEGNPGGLTVMMQIIEKRLDKGLFTLLDLDDMNIRGAQIWVGYKDHCKQDLDVFLKAIDERDTDMVAAINTQCFHPNLVDKYGEVYGERARVNRHAP